MKFVHAADLHLDSPLRGLARYPGAPVDELRMASRRACENLVELCLIEQAQLLVIAGDLYDGDWRDYSTGLFFAAQLARLREAAVRVVLVRGNHDAASQITRHLRLPDNVRDLAVNEAESVIFDELGVVVHGRGFASRAVTENLAESYPARIPQLLNLGLLHTSVNGRPGHETYAPCALDTLKHKGYDYWALGHVHTREVLSQQPYVVFPGNLQSRHAREPGDKGATLVTYDESGIVRVEHRTLDVVRYASLEIDVSKASTFDDALERGHEALAAFGRKLDRTTALRVCLSGASRAHAALHAKETDLLENLRAAATDLGAGQLWLEKLVIASRPHAPGGVASLSHGALGELLGYLQSLRKHDAALLALANDELADLRAKLPAELREGHDALRLDDPEYLRGELDSVEQLLLARLFGEEALP
jgi:exonuclease SbcD